MKIWLSKNSEISLRDQLARQIVLAIVAGDLRPNERLPSVREMALRHKIHQNTVGAAYADLQKNGWIEMRRGSGSFVCEKSAREIEAAASDSQNELDRIISQFLAAARAQGFSSAQIAEKINAKLRRTKFNEIVLIENEPELRKILAFEIAAAIDLPIRETSLDNQSVFVGLTEIAKNLPSEAAKIELKLNSVQNELRDKSRPAGDEIIGIASGCETFLIWAQTMLLAAGLSNEQLILRDTKTENWQRGLSSCAFVIADSLTAANLPKNIRVQVFRLIADSSLEELRNFI